MTPVMNPVALGFTLHTRSSVTIPGSWGVLAAIWPPAAYAAAMYDNVTERGKEP